MQQTFPRLFLGSSTCSSAFCITDMHQHQEMLREGKGCKRQRGRKPGRPQQASVCFGIERKQLVFTCLLCLHPPSGGLCSGKDMAALGSSPTTCRLTQKSCTHSGTSVWDSQFACPSGPRAGGGGSLHVCVVHRWSP